MQHLWNCWHSGADDVWDDPAAHYDAQAPSACEPLMRFKNHIESQITSNHYNSEYLPAPRFATGFFPQLTSSSGFSSMRNSDSPKLCPSPSSGHPGKTDSNPPRCACETSTLLPRLAKLVWFELDEIYRNIYYKIIWYNI